ncbi:MAG: hypothetical protein AAGD43_04685 [Pseudomonadota bacterium]
MRRQRYKFCKERGAMVHKDDPDMPMLNQAERARPPQTPMLAPAFETFKTGETETAEVITSRNEKREYMERNDLVEYDDGVSNAETWIDDKNHEREIVQDLKRFHETDPLNLSPDLKAKQMDSKDLDTDGTDINTDNIEVIK